MTTTHFFAYFAPSVDPHMGADPKLICFPQSKRRSWHVSRAHAERALERMAKRFPDGGRGLIYAGRCDGTPVFTIAL